jgi:hypothetical protein
MVTVTEVFLQNVATEVTRARKMFPGDAVTFAALVEEVGELAKALLDQPGKSVWMEAVQVAAMAARVALDGDSSFDALRANRKLDNHRHHSRLTR